jgi:hypothetical protein
MLIVLFLFDLIFRQIHQLVDGVQISKRSTGQDIGQRSRSESRLKIFDPKLGNRLLRRKSEIGPINKQRVAANESEGKSCDSSGIPNSS